EVIGNQFISIYPNPVFGSQFKITFENKATGDYTITLTDVQGKIIMTRKVFVRSAGQVEIIQLKTKPANGMYMIKVNNANKKSVYSDKIVIE
ncbi:MAG: T9SS type A sorting domain-containing protein, partial [Ginsengibacter sp.]